MVKAYGKIKSNSDTVIPVNLWEMLGGDLPPTNCSKGEIVCVAFKRTKVYLVVAYCDRVAMLQLEIWSHNWRFFIDVFDACFYCLLTFSFCLFQY